MSNPQIRNNESLAMKKLISFSLFLGIILILIAARSVEAQVIVMASGRPLAAVVPVVARPACHSYAIGRRYPGRVIVARPRHRHRVGGRVRGYQQL